MDYSHVTFYEITEKPPGFQRLKSAPRPIPVNHLTSNTLFRIINPNAKSDFTVPPHVRTAAAHVWLKRWETNHDGIRTFPHARHTTRLAEYIINQAETIPPPRNSISQGGGP